MAAAELVIEEVARIAGRAVMEPRIFAHGHGTDIYLADFRDGSGRIVIKRARQPEAALDTEGWMLAYLAERSVLPVPKVHCAVRSLLIMDYVRDTGRLTGAAEEDAARLLAALHAIRAPQYGLDRDTPIGPLRQPNVWSDDWLSFFRDYRLMFMARKGVEEGSLPFALVKSMERVAASLDRWIGNARPPSLIHGDLWSGNVMTGTDRINGFIDPSIYYADPEIELAFISLFSTFGERFFKAYAELAGIEDGFFEARRDIYALYPLLVHARLFGGPYIDRINHIADRLTG